MHNWIFNCLWLGSAPGATLYSVVSPVQSVPGNLEVLCLDRQSDDHQGHSVVAPSTRVTARLRTTDDRRLIVAEQFNWQAYYGESPLMQHG